MSSRHLTSFDYDVYDPSHSHGAYQQQEFIEYVRQQQGRSFTSVKDFKELVDQKKISPDNIVAKVDHVDPSLVGGFIPEQLFEWLLRSKVWLNIGMFQPVRYILRGQQDIDNGFATKGVHSLIAEMQCHGLTAEKLDPVHHAEQIEKNQMKKRVHDREPPKLSPILTQVFMELYKTSKLFTRLEYLRPPPRNRTSVGAFLVEKGNTGTFRVIVDARWTNASYDSKADKYSLFTIEALRQVIDNLSVTFDNQPATWYVLNLDLRHWYHQIPLPARYKHDMVVTLETSNSTLELVPRAVPMGWVKSCSVAQSCTWGMLLCSERGTVDRTGFNLPANYVKNMTSTPRWVPLDGGGGIFVILDNVLVVTPHQHFRDKWFESIYSKAEKCNAVLKVKADPEPKPFTNEYKLLLLKQSCFTMTPTTEIKTSSTMLATVSTEPLSEFEFMGIRWQHSSHYIAVPSDERNQVFPDGTTEFGGWTGSRANLASILGKIIWYRRIWSRKMNDESATSTNLRAIYEQLTPPDGDWRSRIEICSEHFGGILETWKERGKQLSAPARPQNTRFESYILIATDAATTSSLAAAVFFGGQNVEHKTWKYDKALYDIIALAELYAILQAVRDDRCRNIQLIILGTDSMNCKAWIERGYAENKKANEMLRELEDLLAERGQRLYVIYIDTEVNVADDPTRGKPIDETRRLKTLVLLQRAYHECMGMWRIAGSASGSMQELQQQ